MKRILLLTFDLIRPDEPCISLSAGTLLSRLKSHAQHGSRFCVDHVSFNLLRCDTVTPEAIIERIAKSQNLQDVHAIAVGCYVWCRTIVNQLIPALRQHGFSGMIILGGYDIINRDICKTVYPGGNLYLLGYAEESLLRAIEAPDSPAPTTMDDCPILSKIPSPYTTGTIPVREGEGRVRIETKRGCIRNCSYCAHKDLIRRQLYVYGLERVEQEIAFLKSKRVRKINVIDPLFNCGSTYIQVMKMLTDSSVQSTVSFQVAFEQLNGHSGNTFLDLCSSLDTVLEFGLQTTNANEARLINRQNVLPHASKVMKILADRSIAFEVSLIYGLPAQTLTSFRQSIAFLRDNGCKRIRCFPLMLFYGTDLWLHRERWHLSETAEGDFNLPLVTSSDSFTEDDWREMRRLAESLNCEEGEGGKQLTVPSNQSER